ncbi:12704_t:CDS:1, partial [Dentiscutata heterogama]
WLWVLDFLAIRTIFNHNFQMEKSTSHNNFQMEESASHDNILLPTALDFEDESSFVSINADRLSVKYIGE